MHVLFLAKGTRGDVQPVALLAHAVRARNPRLLLHFVTHLDHQHWLSEVVGSCDTQFTYLNSTPARVWHVQQGDATPSKKRNHQQTLATSAQTFQSDSDLEESVAAVQQSLLAALHIAECLCVPCLAVSPCLVPYTFPTSFPRRFKKACPGQVSWSEVEHWLWPAFSPRWTSWRQKRLQLSPTLFNVNSAAAPPTHALHHTSGVATRTVNTSGGCHKSSEGHSVPQGVDNSTNVDTSQKGSSSITGSSGCSGGGGGSGSGGGGGIGGGGGSGGCSSGTGGRVGGGGSGDSSGSCSLPASIPLLYGLSEQVIMRPGYWPSSVHCCGFWQQKHTGTESVRKQKLNALLETVLPQSCLDAWRPGQPLLCIDFGSMGCLGLIPDPHHLVAVLVAALQKAGAKGILLTGGWKPLLLAAKEATQQTLEKPVLIAAAESVPHSLLLPDCSGVIHHGGAGTCAAVLTAGLPHLVCPFHFDQFSWAERLMYLGVALQGSIESLVGSNRPSTTPLAKPPLPPSQLVLPRAFSGSTPMNPPVLCPPNPPGVDPPDKSTDDSVPQPPAAFNVSTPMNPPVLCPRNPHGVDPPDDSVSQPPAALLAAQQLVAQLSVLLSGQLNQQCESLQAALQGEDGIRSAVNILLQQLENAAVPRRNAIPPLQLSGACRSHETEGTYSTCPALEAQPSIASQQRVDAEALVTLPNGWQVPACSKAEAIFIYDEIVDQQCYLQEGIQINNGDIVMDIGANIGLFAWWVLHKAPGRGQAFRVLAVEPISQNVAVMQANLQRHGLTSQVQVVLTAAGQTEGEAVFRYYPAMPGNSTCHVHEKEQLQREHMAAHFFADSQDCVCPVTTISHLMNQHGMHEISLLKIDAEGCELEVLQGIQPHHWGQISQIVLEVHDTTGRLHQIVAILEAENYLVACKQGLGPETHMAYARRS